MTSITELNEDILKFVKYAKSACKTIENHKIQKSIIIITLKFYNFSYFIKNF